MKNLTAQDVAELMDYNALIETLRSGFAGAIITPVRHHHTIERPDQTDATLLLMPAWQDVMNHGSSVGSYVGIKMVTVYPDNEERLQNPSILGTYMLLDGESGTILALLDGPTLTVWRTACASALAADYLARKDASHLLMLGTGALASHLVRAHCAIRPINKISLWGRKRDKAAKLAETFTDLQVEIDVVDDLQAAACEADVISCATMAKDPIIRGAWLKPGSHLDLVGAFRPYMREADDDAVIRSSVYVDTIAGATKEGGDITQPLANGSLSLNDIRGDLFGLCRNNVQGRERYEEITLFKSVGTALEDLAAAQFVYEKSGRF